MNRSIGKIGYVQLGPSRGAVSWYQSFDCRSTKDDASNCIDSYNLRAQIVCLYVLSAPAQRATRAGRAKQVIYFSIEVHRDLMHRLPVGHGVEDVGILIGPKAVGNGSHQRAHSLDACVQILFSYRIGLSHDVHFGAVGFEKLNILLRRLWIYD